MAFLLAILVACAFIPEFQCAGYVTVHLSQGALRGLLIPAEFSNTTFFGFRGIPYAKPPVQQLRFQAPESVGSWGGVRDALQEGDMCMQTTGEGSEDCLYLNVYTPQLPSANGSTGLPVMVWVHGGGFTSCSSSSQVYGPEFLVGEGVVLVTVNYRLGVFGFLSLEGTDVTANNGLRDQQQALRWVQQNIASFGGDPSKVTVFGQSAGGASVHYLLMSPLSKGLFVGAISQSGSAFNPWAYSSTPTQRALRLARSLGYTGPDDAPSVAAYLRSKDSQDLATSEMSALTQEEKSDSESYPFVPTAESNSSSEAVLPGRPAELMESGSFLRVPIIMGSTSAEAKMSATSMNKSASSWKKVNSNMEAFVPVELGLVRGSQRSKDIAARIKRFYFGTQDVSFSTVQQYSDLASDFRYVRGVYKSVSEILKYSRSPLYNYQFAFDGQLNYGYMQGANTTIRGAGHADELCYLFLCRAFKDRIVKGTPEFTNIQRMVSMWTNFAKTGVPDGDSWKAATMKDRYYLQIDRQLTLKKNPERRRMAFWDDIYSSSVDQA